MTHPQFIVLAALGYFSQQQQEIKQVMIAKQTEIDVMTFSTILKNSEKQQLILRSTSSQDSRAKYVRLTEKGQQVLAQALSLVEALEEEFIGILGDQGEQLNQLLIKLIPQAE